MINFSRESATMKPKLDVRSSLNRAGGPLSWVGLGRARVPFVSEMLNFELGAPGDILVTS